MKKFTSFLLVTILLLSSVCVTHAAVVPIISYQADMEGSFNSAKGTYINNTDGSSTGFQVSHSSNAAATTSEFLVAGSAANKKLSSDQMLMAQLFANGTANTNWNRGKLIPSSEIAFLPGQQIYMRAQYYLPSKSYQGESYASYNDNFMVRMIGAYADANGTKSSLTYATFEVTDSAGGSIYFMGNSNNGGIKAVESWKYDTWYTVEAIMTAGDNASVSVYVNGSPLSFTGQSFQNSQNYSTGKNCIKVPAKEKQWLYSMKSDNMKTNAIKRHLYTDNWAFEVYAANAEVPLWTPPVYNPVTFTSHTNGDTMRTNELKTVTVDTDAEKCDWVALYVDDELVSSDAQAPYSFDITKRYDPGTHTLRAVAKSGSDTYEKSIDITLTPFNPLSFVGIANGDEVYDRKFRTVTIDTEDEPCENVSLYIDDVLIETKTQTPYVFELPNALSIGDHTLCVKAMVGTTEYSSQADITVLEYNPLTIAGISNGSKASMDDFGSLTVLTGDETADEVSLYVDNELISTISSAPFSFDASQSCTPGAHTLRAEARVGADVYEIAVDVTVVGTYDKAVMNQNFEVYASFYDAQNGGWYNASSRMHKANALNGWFIQPAAIEDKNGKMYGQSFSLGCDPGSSSSYNDSNNKEYNYLTFGYTKMTGVSNAVVSGNKVKLEWYTLFSNDKTQEFVMSLNSNTGAGMDNPICQWDTTEKKLKWNVSGLPLTAVEANKWQKYTLVVDLADASTKMSLWIDDALQFDSLASVSPFNSFLKVIWKYVPDYSAGSFVALDEIRITHVIPRPSFVSASFYTGDAHTADESNVSPLSNAIAVVIDGGLIENGLNENVELLENGKAVKAVDSAGNELRPAVMLSGNKLWIVPHIPLLPDCEYSIKLGADAMFENNVTIGYDQYLSFTTAKAVFAAKSVSFSGGGSVNNGDAIGANVTFSNLSGESKNVKLVLALYSGNKLMSISVKPVTVTASPSAQSFSADDAIVKAANDFSARLIVLSSDNYPIAQYEMGD